MVYNRIPGVDSAGNFPPEVRNALLNSPEIGDVRLGLVPIREGNLFNIEDTTLGTLSPSGNVNAHASNRTSGFIPVVGGEDYVSYYDSLSRIVWFDADKVVIAGTDTDYTVAETVYNWVAPSNAAYARMTMVLQSTDTTTPPMIFNRGDVLLSSGDTLDSGWWDDRELPPTPVVEGVVPAREGNLFNIEDATLGTLSASGNVNEHASNLTSGFIPVVAGERYVSYNETLSRVIWYDASKSVITGMNTEYLDRDTVHNWVAPSNAAYVRMTMTLASNDTTTPPMIFNRGDIPLPPGTGLESGWWDDRELPPGVNGGIDPDELSALIQTEVDKAVPHYEPSFPTLNFESIYTGYDTAQWLSSDGVMLYGSRGHILIQSDDEWATRQDIVAFDTPLSISAVRSLDNGELLVAQGRSVSEGRKARLMLSSGYDRSNPTAATWSQVLEAGSVEAQFNNSWGLQTYQNVVIAGEYGLWGEDGARHVWMSEDYGATFRLVFDFKTDVPDGGPEWGEKAHIHTAAWDPYWSRIWIACGDNPSTATYYSDDKGVTWNYVEGTGYGGDAVQYTGVLALPDVVLFGSDRAPNGVHSYRRGLKSDMPVIKPLLLVDDSDVITRVFQLPYKRDWAPTTETYFTATNAGGRGRSIIVGTVDGKKAHLMWESEDPAGEEAFSGNVHFALGPTAQGNIIARMSSDPTVTGIRVMKAPAPTWSRV